MPDGILLTHFSRTTSLRQRKIRQNHTRMSLFSRASHAVRDQGVFVLVHKLWIELVDRWFDFRLGVDTCRWADLDQLSITGENKGHGFRYEPGRVVINRKLFQHIRANLSDELVVVDLGAGKGRVLLIAAEFDAVEATGVEFAHELCEVARKNCRQYALKTGCRTRFEVVESDVVDYAFRPAENVFVFFNPFDDVVMRAIIGKIVTSLEQNPRKVLICYYNPLFGDLIESHPKFKKLVSPKLRGYQFTIYTNI
jgi:hypothetical protein